ncbi:MAG: hypothetical protein ACK5T0_10250 [Vampirovibrionales bacterium]|jgi:hypothetical protein
MSYNLSSPTPKYNSAVSQASPAEAVTSKPLVIPKLNAPAYVTPPPPPLANSPLTGPATDQMLTSRSFSDLVRQVQQIQEQLNVLQANQNLTQRQQMINPVQYLSQNGLGNIISNLFGGRRQMQTGKTLTDAEQDAQDDTYFEEVEAPKVFSTTRVEKTSNTNLS